MDLRQTRETIQEYYGRVLKSKADLQTGACCTAEALSTEVRELLKDIHPEVKEKFYGCGSPLPAGLEGKTVLDLGCGTGRDCYLLSRMVGPTGKVIGVDMTDEQLEVAHRHVDFHTKAYGYAAPNVQFLKGYIENLEEAGIRPGTVDVVVSNCVVNLSPDKERVFREVLKALKPGGELYFSDVFADRRLSATQKTDPLLVGECLGGALYTEDFRRMLYKLGVPDFRVVTRSPISAFSDEVTRKIGNASFFSLTVRAFKIDSLEDRCEDYGQVAYYLGTVPGHAARFVLDDHHTFETGRPLLVCSNTAAMLAQSRFGKHFRIEGNTSTHFGLFDCGPSPVAEAGAAPGACC